MSAIEELRSYAKRLQDRFRLGVMARGAAALAALALVATVVLVVVSSHFAFSEASLWSARATLLVALGLGAAFGLAIPLWRWSQRLWVRRAELRFPQFGQRLLTFNEREQQADPFLELLAADTLKVARTADVKSAVPNRLLAVLLALGLASLGALVWLIHAGPGYLGYGARALWTGPPAVPFYRILVTPGDATVRRHADSLVTARLAGMDSRPLAIHVRSGKSGQWEQAAMQQRPSRPGYQFLFAGIAEDVEYYVSQGGIESKHFRLRVADIPAVKQIRVTYRAPQWMHQPEIVEEHGGDLKAIAGTEALLEIRTDLPMPHGVLVLDDGKQIPLVPAEGNIARATVTLQKDGTYHVAARDTGVGTQRITEDYFIEVGEVKPPEVALVRPEHDYRATPIEEVTIAAEASDPFGLTDFALRYSVNGGPEQSVGLLSRQEAGTQKGGGSTVLSLEGLKLVPGDVVSFYALAKDARAESHTDMAFIQIEPFEREFSQSQQGGGGAGGGGGNEQAQIAEREKEIIAATWRESGLQHPPAAQAAEQAKFLSDVQTTLRGQAEALSGRLQMRDLQLQNEQFGSFEQDMAAAADAMRPAAQKLAAQSWKEAVPDEQKALQYLLRAEATFRQIQVAFGSAAGSGTPNSAGRDLASLFDLELDTQKNQYESAQTAATSQQRAAQIDDALKKLDELARRQNALAEQNRGEQSAEQRWQQEMLRRKVEELTQQLQQLARNGQQSGSPSQQSGQSGQQGQSQGQQSQQERQAREALSRLRQAQESMRRASEESSPDAARQAAQQVREAMNLLGGMQTQDAGKQIDSLAREAQRLGQEQRQQAGRMRSVEGPTFPGSRLGRDRMEALINDRQKLADDLAKLQGDMRSAERATLEHNKDAAKKLREALSDLEQADTETQMQRSADRMRRGYGPLGDSPEDQIAESLQRLQEQLGQARQAMASGGGNGKSPGAGALDAAERLRGRLAALDESLRRQGEATGGGRGSTGGPVNGAWNSGNNGPLRSRVAPERAPPVDPEQVFRQASRDMEQLRRAVQEDPEARREVEDLIRSMQKLDPKRFPGNPAMVDEMYSRTVAGVDRLELQLRHQSADSAPGQVRSDSAAPVPDGYQAAVADYFRRLSKNQNP
jgi:hypothetical protein